MGFVQSSVNNPGDNGGKEAKAYEYKNDDEHLKKKRRRSWISSALRRLFTRPAATVSNQRLPVSVDTRSKDRRRSGLPWAGDLNVCCLLATIMVGGPMRECLFLVVVGQCLIPAACPLRGVPVAQANHQERPFYPQDLP